MEKLIKKNQLIFDYKDTSSLKKFMSEKGKITPRNYISMFKGSFKINRLAL